MHKGIRNFKQLSDFCFEKYGISAFQVKPQMQGYQTQKCKLP